MASRPMILLFLILNIQTISGSQNWIKAGYWHYQSELPVSEINSPLFTHLLCAFAYINSSTYKISINSTYQQSFFTFTNTVKLRNPSITTLLSIWVGKGMQQSSVFSSMTNQSSHRKSFIESAIETARLHDYHGLNLCGNFYSDNSTMTNLGILLDELHVAVTSDARISKKSQLSLTMCVYSSLMLKPTMYPIQSLKRNLDWVHLTGYDYYLPTRDNFTNPHSALYGSSLGMINTNDNVKLWLNSGFEANKLLLGLPYHGYAWTLVNPTEKYVGAPASGAAITMDGSIGYKLIKAYIQNYGYGTTAVYNSTFAVNIFTSGSTWINFDDVKSVRAKISFAKEKGFLGYCVFQLANDDKWELSSAAQDGEDHQLNKKLLLIILVTVVPIILLLGTAICFSQSTVLKSTGVMSIVKRSVSKLKFGSRGDNASNNLQVFDFTTIKVATHDFSSENKLGEGGYGPVYKGILANGMEIAVKRLSKTSRQGLEEFKNEVRLTARLQHVNLVPVVGICTEREEKMLIYEYMSNKSLDAYIFDPCQEHLLNWDKRVHIIQGITQGLLYLHEYSNFTIVHRDLKASNILLDKEMNPRISDFGLARAFTSDECEANTGNIVGTYGYVPPEYVRRGIYSMKYDVYSFGVFLLQIISGKRTACYYGPNENFNLLEYAYELWKEGKGMEFLDSWLDDSMSSCKLTQCMQVGLLCVQEDATDRPTMLEVSNMLKAESGAIPTPKKPAFSIKRDNDDESECPLKVNIYPTNDVTITQLLPR